MYQRGGWEFLRSLYGSAKTVSSLWMTECVSTSLARLEAKYCSNRLPRSFVTGANSQSSLQGLSLVLESRSAIILAADRYGE